MKNLTPFYFAFWLLWKGYKGLRNLQNSKDCWKNSINHYLWQVCLLSQKAVIGIRLCILLKVKGIFQLNRSSPKWATATWQEQRFRRNSSYNFISFRTCCSGWGATRLIISGCKLLGWTHLQNHDFLKQYFLSKVIASKIDKTTLQNWFLDYASFVFLSHGHWSEWKSSFLQLWIRYFCALDSELTPTFSIPLVLSLRSLHLQWGHCSASKYSVLSVQSNSSRHWHGLHRQCVHLGLDTGLNPGVKKETLQDPKCLHL